MLIGQICDFGHDGDSHYRLHAPTRQLAALPGVVAVDCHFYHRLLPQLIEQADVLVLQFVNDWDWLAICSHRRRLGKVTIFEANDYFFDLQPWSPIAAAWSDREVQELYIQLMRHADGVQTSTRFLAKKWQELGAREVVVFENHLVSMPELPPLKERAFTVGWAGSPGHFADLLHIVPSLERWLGRRPDARLAIMTNDLAKSFFHLNQEKLQFRNFSSLEDYLGFLASLDVGLAPLLPTDYNRGRSDVKFLEYSSRGVPGIYQKLEPYREVVREGENGFFCHDPESLLNKLEMLYQDKALRERVRSCAHYQVKRDRLLENHIGERLDWYTSLMPGKPAPASHPILQELQPFADGEIPTYHAVKPQQEEKDLLQALGHADVKEGGALLQNLVERTPPHGVALLHLPQRLNDIRLPDQALELEPLLRKLAPYSLRWKMEMARATFIKGDYPAAQKELEILVEQEPACLPAWKYLVKLLEVKNNPAGALAARKCLEVFPNCYSLAIHALGNFPWPERVLTLRQVLHRLRRGLALFEIPLALRLIRRTVLDTLNNQPATPDTLGLMQTACELFPDSQTLRQELANQLRPQGEGEAWLKELAAVGKMRVAQVVAREENQPQEAPFLWQFAVFIEKVLSKAEIPPGPHRGV
ncbi:MAG: hypothetical protein EXR99_15925 [Gemmataceae bacterium]|nr:hypothetical protein [Gemmataceae bacterium]